MSPQFFKIPDTAKLGIIDKADAGFLDVPDSLAGDVLLERTVDSKGNITGYITATKAVTMAQKGKTPAELAAEGWSRHQPVLDALTVAELSKP